VHSSRSLLLATGALALALLAPAAGCAPAAPAPPQRIVFILVDTLRRDPLSIYGGPVPTPNLARLAEHGVVLNATASFHQTTMSMGAIFSGRTPSIESPDAAEPLVWRPNTWCGLARFASKGEQACIPAAVPTLGEAMRARGYRTVGVVSNSLLFRPAGFDRGFDTWVEVGEDAPKEIADPVARAAQRSAARVNRAVRAALDPVPAGRLFLYVHYLDVHDFRIRGVSYDAAVAGMDAALGELLGDLRARGLLEDAAVVFTADHGEAFKSEEHVLHGLPGHAGNPSFQSVLDIPLVVTGRDPAELGPLVRTQDLFSLLTGLAGSAAPAQGPLAADEVLLSERYFRTYIEGRYKSIRSRVTDRMVLIDLEGDPQELRDVAPEHPEIAREQRQRVDALSRELETRGVQIAPLSDTMVKRLRELGYLAD
jgi:choline-sulfatase